MVKVDAAAYLKDVEKARRSLRALIASKNCAPIMLRLAWHDAGTYDANTKIGGANGSIRNHEELSHAANNGLAIAIALCGPLTHSSLLLLSSSSIHLIHFCYPLPEEVKNQSPLITYADLYQLAGVVAVEITGGPTIHFVPGRKDSLVSPREGKLPDAKQELLKGETDGLLKLPTDKSLLEDPEFRHYVELYSKDEDAFFKDYAISHKKLSELGFTPSSSGLKMEVKNTAILAQSAVGVTVAAAVVAMSYFYEVHRRTK
ncbi:hypothetical protein Syun_015816 [Stephania yunnanensis]|uniref:Plant heme peroxidase family profile domain-containing protein n=1 Tax=Stephania yunnanensis TaxID=152371 RepID=A0AAP0JMX1_9MAGN